MFFERRCVVLAVVVGIIFLNVNTLAVSAQAQPDNFPIGLDLEYEDKWTSGGIGVYTSTDSIEIHFIQWVDESQSIVEINNDGTTEQYAFPSELIEIGSGVPLWVDTSQWSDGQNITFQGQIYSVKAVSRTVEAGVYACWELTYHSFQSSTIHYYYQRSLGILIIYISMTIQDIAFNQQVYELTNSNLEEFMNIQTLTIDMIISVGIMLEVCGILYLYYRNKS